MLDGQVATEDELACCCRQPAGLPPQAGRAGAAPSTDPRSKRRHARCNCAPPTTPSRSEYLRDPDNAIEPTLRPRQLTALEVRHRSSDGFATPAWTAWARQHLRGARGPRPFLSAAITAATSATGPSRCCTCRATRPAASGCGRRRAGVLFSGDAVYDGPLLDELDGSDIDDYCATMRRLRDLPVRRRARRPRAELRPCPPRRAVRRLPREPTGWFRTEGFTQSAALGRPTRPGHGRATRCRYAWS